jgi:DNA-binding transcriptional ArsR family regulator
MLSKVLKTPVDDLVKIVQENKNCTINFLVENMKLDRDSIEKWLIVLEEYKILKLNYKGFEGYVTYVENENDVEKKNIKEKGIDIDTLKDQFIEKCNSRGFTSEQTHKLWPEFISKYLVEIRELFFKTAQKKGYENYQVAIGWNKYQQELMKF